MKIESVKSWKELSRFESDWNRLWLDTELIDREVYLFEFIKSINVFSRGIKPFCLIFSSNSEVTHIVPLKEINRRITRLKIPITKLTFFGSEFNWRHSFCLGKIDNLPTGFWETFKRKIVYSKTDYIELIGISEFQTHMLIKNLSNNKVKCLIKERIDEPGSYYHDLLAIEIKSTWNDFVCTVSKNFENHIRKVTNRCNSVKNRFWRRVNGVCDDGVDYKVGDLIDIIFDIEKNCWQKDFNVSIGRFGKVYLNNLLGILIKKKIEDFAILFIDEKPVAYYIGCNINKYVTYFFYSI